jgi:hypothetical protein
LQSFMSHKIPQRRFIMCEKTTFSLSFFSLPLGAFFYSFFKKELLQK